MISLVLLILYGWTLTETADFTLRVANGVCTAELYGRSSALPCPGLAGGRLEAITGKSVSPLWRDLLAQLTPGSAWEDLVIRDGGGIVRSISDPLPDAFEVKGTLRRPNEPAALVLLPAGSTTGWAFSPEGATRRGIWSAWQDGKAASALQGIPYDKPFVSQVQSLLRSLFVSWQGAIVIVLAALLIAQIGKHISTRNIAGGLESIINLDFIFVPATFIFIFAVSLYVSTHILERIPHVQDSVTYLFQAQTLARAELTAPAPPLSETKTTPHFDQEFLLVRDGRWFGKYPPGYPAILALGVLLNAHWLVNPLLATLSAALILALSRQIYRPLKKYFATRIFDRGHAAWAADQVTKGPTGESTWHNLIIILLGVSPFFLVMSGSLMAHATELLLTSVFMLAWVRAVSGGRSWWAVSAGAALGMLFLTRQYTALTIGLAFGAGWAVIQLGQSTRFARRLTVQVLLTRGMVVLAATLPFVICLFAYQAAVTGHPFTDPRLLFWPYDRVGFGPGFGESQNVFSFVETSAGPAQQWQMDPTQPPRGNSPSLGLYNLGRNLVALESTLFAWPPLFTLAFVWLAFLLRRPSAADWGLLLVAIAVAGGYVAYWQAGIAYGPRYFYAALPALVILSARGVRAMAITTGRAAYGIVAVLILAGLASLPRQIAEYRNYNFVSPQPMAQVEQNVERPALVFVSASATDWWEYGAFFSGNTPWLDGEVVYARHLGSPENDRLRATFPGRVAYLWRNGALKLLDSPPVAFDR